MEANSFSLADDVPIFDALSADWNRALEMSDEKGVSCKKSQKAKKESAV